MRTLRSLPIVLALTLVACTSESSSTGTTTTTSTSTTTTAVATTTTVPCPTSGDLLVKGTGEPLTMSSLIGNDIRIDELPCSERITISLQGTGEFPGWMVEYVDDPVQLGMSGETAFIEGDATLLVRMGMWMQTMEGDGYQGSFDLLPDGTAQVREMRLVENWEGISHWAIGLDSAVPFTVTVLQDPPRLVIELPL